jgi:2-oxoglutarate ferredoxin oxidoreductase subunit alpha
MASLVFEGFDLADRYRNPVLILSDGALGQMMEKVTFPPYDSGKHRVLKPWATDGAKDGKERRIITSLHIQPEKMEELNLRLEAKYKLIREQEVRFESVGTADAEYLVVAYGLSARIAHRAVDLARDRGIKAGLLRPITLFPYPTEAIQILAQQVRGILVVEMNAGQMVEDVRLAVEGATPVRWFGRMGGIVPSPDEVLQAIEQMAGTPQEATAGELVQ